MTALRESSSACLQRPYDLCGSTTAVLLPQGRWARSGLGQCKLPSLACSPPFALVRSVRSRRERALVVAFVCGTLPFRNWTEKHVLIRSPTQAACLNQNTSTEKTEPFIKTFLLIDLITFEPPKSARLKTKISFPC